MLDWLQWAKGMMLGPGYDARYRISEMWEVSGCRSGCRRLVRLSKCDETFKTLKCWVNFFEGYSTSLQITDLNMLAKIKPTIESWKRTHLTKKSPTKLTKFHPCKKHQIVIFGGNSPKRYVRLYLQRSSHSTSQFRWSYLDFFLLEGGLIPFF